MTIYPAIDLYDGKVVRLVRGDYSDMTVYSEDPAAELRRFRACGATYAHIVDLAGARDGTPASFDLIKHIVSQTDINIQVGGGIRTYKTIDEYLSIGVRRVILGTAAVSWSVFMKNLLNEYGDAIAVSVDIKDGKAAIKGWSELSVYNALDFCKILADIGVKTIICTDISKDGLLGGTNMELYRTLRKTLSVDLIASGGISTLDEIRALSALGIDGAILGKALYTGQIKLMEAIAAASSEQ